MYYGSCPVKRTLSGNSWLTSHTKKYLNSAHLLVVPPKMPCMALAWKSVECKYLTSYFFHYLPHISNYYWGLWLERVGGVGPSGMGAEGARAYPILSRNGPLHPNPAIYRPSRVERRVSDRWIPTYVLAQSKNYKPYPRLVLSAIVVALFCITYRYSEITYTCTYSRLG
jgi:hypothetical protein